MAKYQRRYQQSSRLPSTDGLRIALSRMEQQSSAQIKGLERYASQEEKRDLQRERDF